MICPCCGKPKRPDGLDGYGTALKPAMELIALARKPLSESSIAANVLKWGTGALNIDACRIDLAGIQEHWANYKPSGKIGFSGSEGERNGEAYNSKGRWPANLIHDGSVEVVAAFPDADGAVSNGRKGVQGACYGEYGAMPQVEGRGDSGSAARFFYTSKADADDRLGSKHPTVKPVDLMQWLVRLVTPKGGTTLDPFAGTGTTGEAAWREGCKAFLIEREEEYQADIRRRMKLVLAGRDERARESFKVAGKIQSHETLPLFRGGS